MTRRVPSLGYLVWHLSLKWRVAVERVLSPLGLTHAHYALLASLYALSRDGRAPSQRELADFSGLEAMYVSKLARGLERTGLLKRTDHPDDPRAFQLQLTRRGSDLVVQAAKIVSDLYEELLTPVGGGHSKQAVSLMRTLETLLEHARRFNRESTGGASSLQGTRRTS